MSSSSSITTSSVSSDFQVQPGPNDTISELAFCPVADFLAASSWDNQVRVYQIQSNVTGNSSATQINAFPKASMTHESPALCCSWSQDGSKLFSGGCDKKVQIMDVNSGQTINFVAHDNPIKSIRWDPINNTVVTGSWDKTIKYWDLRQSTPAATINLPERCYSMDIAGNLLVVATAERHVVVVYLNQPTTIFKTLTSQLKWQTRCIAAMHNSIGFAIGSIEGRCGITYLEDKRSSDSFSFKCHRDGNNAFAVNALSFHPVHGTMSTAGADGAFYIWDKDSKHKLKGCPNLGGPVTASAFSRTSDIFAYGIGYDWSKGYENYLPNAKNGILIQKLAKSDIEPKPAASSTLTGFLKKR